MALVAELVTDEQIAALAAHGVPTGLADLDWMTRGLLPGAVWVVLGTPGVGRTVLACQLAGSAAAAGADTVLLLGREPASTATANLVAAQASVAEHRLRAGTLTADERSRTTAAAHAMAGWPLRVLVTSDERWEYSGGVSVPDAAAWLEPEAASLPVLGRVTVIDDLDLLTPRHPLDVLPRLCIWAQRTGQTIVVTLPEELGLQGEMAVPALRRHADVVLRLQRPDLHPAAHPRAGEADLEVLRHRQGPVAQIVLAFQGHYRRFRDLT
jgi:replicative DNA helicase